MKRFTELDPLTQAKIYLALAEASVARLSEVEPRRDTGQSNRTHPGLPKRWDQRAGRLRSRRRLQGSDASDDRGYQGWPPDSLKPRALSPLPFSLLHRTRIRFRSQEGILFASRSIDLLSSSHMYFGCHVSVAGGLQNAPLNAAELGCEVFQFFSRSPQGGPAPKITPEMVGAFATNCSVGGFKEWVIHTPYYINFASELERTRQNSARIVREELERATLLGAKYVMFHPGSAGKGDAKQAIEWVIEGVKRLYDGYKGSTHLLLEISAGAGAVIGDTFDEVAEILDGVGHPDMGVCFDTAHAFASGYDLRTKEVVNKTFAEFDKIIGLKRLKMSHCNDSKVELGARKDRHEHLGEGFIGLEGFKAIVHHPKLQHLNLYLETEHDKVVEDLKVLKKMRG